MAKVPMVAIHRHGLVYPSGGGKRYHQGEEFEARSEKDARILIAIRKADFAPAAALAVQPVCEPAAIVAAPSPAEIPAQIVQELAPAEVLEPVAVAAFESDPTAVEEKQSVTEEVAHVSAPETPSMADAKAEVPAAETGNHDAAGDISPRTGKQKRQYTRRDMRSEG